MNCEQAQHMFDAYLDGDLSGTMADEFNAHRLHCAACRRELALLEVAGHVISADTDTPLLDEEFTERLLMAAVAQPRPWYRRRRLVFGASSLAAAACLALVLTYTLGSPGTPQTPAAPTGPMVLSGGDTVTPQELLENVEEALSRDPGNKQLQEYADTIRGLVQGISEDTRDGASELENYGKMTIIEILKSIRQDNAKATNGASAGNRAPEDNDGRAVDDH